ncbi:MAG: ROK family protein [Candidatus Omnitrophota bacterium]|nr:ROK family protein [Candidatus Omnitrophota bacterium]
MKMKDGYIIGVDIASPELIAIMTDTALNVAGKTKMPMQKGNAEELAGKIAELIQGLIKEAKVDIGKVKAVSLGVSGTKPISLKNKIEKKTGIKTFMENNVACASLGEKRLNPEANVENLLYMYSDVGYGIVTRGDTYFGALGGPGEIYGTQYLRPWDAEFGIARAAKKEVEKGVGTYIVELAKGEINNVTEDVVIEAARRNDEVASDIVESVGISLGVRIAYLINLFNPEIVVVGGGIEKADRLILEPINKIVKRLAFRERADTVKIIPGVLGEDAVSLGAAALAIREI